MGPIEAALVCIAVLVVFASYKGVTTRLALEEREKMIPVVREIVNDPNSPASLKQCALAAFHMSADPGFFLNALKMNLLRKNRNANSLRPKDLTKEHDKLFESLTREHFFRVNFLAAPHWYVFTSLLVFVLIIIAMPFFLFDVTRTKVVALFLRLGKSLAHPRFPSKDGALDC